MCERELRDLEAHLRALRQEEEELEVQIHEIREADGGGREGGREGERRERARSCSNSTAQDDSEGELENGVMGKTYSSLAPAAGDVRGRKRAVFIRRSAAVGSLVMGVMLAVTFVSQPLEREDALLDEMGGSVPAVLHEVGDVLSPQDKTAIALRMEASEQLDAWHHKWQKERAAHLVQVPHRTMNGYIHARERTTYTDYVTKDVCTGSCRSSRTAQTSWPPARESARTRRKR
jgi:hypothetical protein